MKHFLGSLEFWKRKGGRKSGGEEKLAASVAACKDAIHSAILDNFATPKVVEAVSKLVLEAKATMDSLDACLAPVEKAAELVEFTMSMLGVEHLRVSKEPKEPWTKAVDTVAALRQEVRDLAKEKDTDKRKKLVQEAVAKASGGAKQARQDGLKDDMADAMDSFMKDLTSLEAPAKLLQRCDQVRDVEMVQLGVRLEDRGTDGFIWMFDQREFMEAEQKEAEEKAKEATRQKIRNKLDQKQKELKVAEKAAISPAELFKNGSNSGVYGAFDAEGVPTTLSSGEELSAKKRKDLAKELAKQQKDFEKLQKQAGEAGIEAFLKKMRSEVADMEKQLQ
ncbi:unnamed protein product [Effrenium voratum]|nr:unnamed protein product [Effrenium voratum]